MRDPESIMDYIMAVFVGGCAGVIILWLGGQPVERSPNMAFTVTTCAVVALILMLLAKNRRC